MSLKELLLDHLKEAMKEKDVVRKNTVQLIRSGILQVEKDNKIVLDDEGVMDVILKELKKRRDSLPEYEKSGREDLIEQLKEEIKVIENYLPQPLSDDEVISIIDEAFLETGASTMKDMGKVMSAINPKVKGRADTRKISDIVKSKLSN